jgi:gliding motility-associated-like protein
MKLLRHIFILLFTIIIICNGYAQPDANFTVSDSTACETLFANFTNTSTGSNLTYQWDFGNGNFSTEQNPTAYYSSPGSYTVKLVVVDDLDDSDTLIKTNYIQIYNAPEVSFSTDDQTIGCPSLEIQFNSNIILGDTLIDNILWDFGDNSFAYEENPNHIYSNPGQYSVGIVVYDFNGCDASSNIQNYITVNSPPTPDFSADVQYSCDDNLSVAFSNTLADQTGLEFYWDFGDNTTSSDPNPSHTYNGYGAYDVMLKVTDDYNCSDSIVKSNFIVLQQINHDIEINSDIICRNDTINITNNSIGINQYQWQFGDGTTSTEKWPGKSYTDSGNYIISLITSYNGACRDTLYDTIKVDNVKAKFSVDKSYLCQLPDTVTYIDQSANASSWLWKFGNGKTSTSHQPKISYELTENISENYYEYYSDTLIIYSENSCVDTAIRDSIVYVHIPKLYYTPNDSAQYIDQISGCVPLEVNFQNYSTSTNPDDPIVAYNWDFGDGTTFSGYNSSHTYTSPGEFTANLVVVNQSGCENSITSSIKTGIPLTADFSFESPDTICGGVPILFFDESTPENLANEWSWHFSDLTSSDRENPTHAYLDTGFVDATLIVLYNGCAGDESVIEKKDIAYVNGPAGSFGFEFECEDPYDYSFHHSLKDADFFKWDFGDGVLDSTQQSPINHTYDTTKTYIPRLYARNINNECELSVVNVLSVRDVKANFQASALAVCLDDSVYMSAEESVDVTVFTWNNENGKFLWTIDDTVNYFLEEPFLSVKLANRGEHDVKLEVRASNGCIAIHDTIVNAFKPIADFSLNESIGCLPFTVDFINNSYSDTTMTEWFWDFNDGFSSTEYEPNHEYTSNGLFDIGLIVKDILDCADTIVKTNSLIASRPLPVVGLSQDIACLYDSISFINQSEGFGVNAIWDFGDSNSSNLFAPKHAYSDTGLYTVSVYMVDSFGCDTNYVLVNPVEVKSLPLANCYANFYSTSCYPVLIELHDQSTGDSIISWQWDFGDNSDISTHSNPIHTYYTPGSYDIKLVVNTIYNCKDTVVKTSMIDVGGPYAEIVMPDTVCKNDEIEISLTDTLNIAYLQWLFPYGSTSSQPTVNYSFANLGFNNMVLYLSSDDFNTCDKTFTDSAFVPTLQSGFDISDTNNCVPFSIDFFDSSIGANSIYWDFDDGDNNTGEQVEHTYESPGVFYPSQTVFNTFGCKDSSSIRIEVYPLPIVNVSNDTLICYGDSIHLLAQGGELYQWSPSFNINNIFIDKPIVFPDSSTVYNVAVIDSNNCIDSANVNVQVQQKPEAMIVTNDTTLIIGTEIELNAIASGASEYYWTPQDYLMCWNCESTNALPLETTTYTFTAIDENQCFNISDSVNIIIDSKYSVDMPNAFTPNNDRINDEICVRGWGIKELLEFSVYNANNKKIFSTDELQQCWDGTESGKILTQGIYYYYVSVLGYDDKVRTKKGSIFLIR